MNLKKYVFLLLLVLFCLPMSAQDGKVTVSGEVVDNQGEPVIGANVLEVGTTNGVITDLDGRFKLSVNSKSEIQVTFIGYTPQTFKANAVPAKIILKEDSEMLQEVVVVGYGTMKKSDLTGAVASIKGTDMEKEQRQTIQDMLRHGRGRPFCRYGDGCQGKQLHADSR